MFECSNGFIVLVFVDSNYRSVYSAFGYNYVYMNRPENIPDAPGSYQFLDSGDRVIYVGKAKSLKNRLNSYFNNSSNLDSKTVQMLSIAEKVEWIQVKTEQDALILEDSLIKRYSPRFNIRLRDDKSYPSVAINLKHEWPRIYVTRNLKMKNTKYFGPYVNAGAIKETLETLQKIFLTRSCTDGELDRHIKSNKPCLMYHIKRCSGPCIGEVSREDYRSYLNDAMKVLSGETRQIQMTLESKMEDFAKNLNFEQAAKLRDRIHDLDIVKKKQTISVSNNISVDIFGIAAGELTAEVKVLTVRNGLLVGHKGFSVDRVEALSIEELIQKAVISHYSETDISCDLILVSSLPNEADLLERWLSNRSGRKILISVPKHGVKNDLVGIAVKNAQEALERQTLKRAYDFNSRSVILTSLRDVLKLSNVPYRIECYDCSHLFGTNYVGSMVVFEDGLPKKSDYRIFKVNTKKNDDYLAMQEVLSRRFKRLASGSGSDSSFLSRPDLVVIDGGKGQLGVAHKVMTELDLDIGLISLAKQFEEVFFPDSTDPLRIPRNSESLFLLERLRDESHRFAIKHHRKLRDKSAISSELRNIPGLGPKTETALLSVFRTVANIREASLEELMGCDLVSKYLATEIYSYFHNNLVDNVHID